MAKIVALVICVVAVAVAAVFVLSWLAVGVAVFGLYRGGRALARRHAHGVELRVHQRAELLARVELQDRWFLEGDQRGTFGRYTPAA